jgi:hypothetical protein
MAYFLYGCGNFLYRGATFCRIFLYRYRDSKEMNTDALSGQGFKFCRMVTVICIPVMLVYIGIFQNKREKVFEALKEPLNMSKIYNTRTTEIL